MVCHRATVEITQQKKNYQQWIEVGSLTLKLDPWPNWMSIRKKNRSNVKTSDFLVKYSHDFCETFDNSWSIVLYQQ